MHAMRKHVYPLSTTQGEVTVTLYRDLNSAFVLFEGPGHYAFNTVDLLAKRVRDLYLEHLDPSGICYVVRYTTRTGRVIVRQVHMAIDTETGHHQRPLAHQRPPQDLDDVLREIDATHPENPEWAARQAAASA